MFSAHRTWQAVALALVLALTGLPVHSQSSNLIGYLAGSEWWSKRQPGAKPCRPDSPRPLSWLAQGEQPAESGADCEEQPLPGRSLLAACEGGLSADPPCGPIEDPVLAGLRKQGKQAQKIVPARLHILEILRGSNACSDWYRLYDPNPAETFRTVGFAVDTKGEEFVHQTRQEVSEMIYHNPYVASVIQSSGPHAIITLNSNGAFFRSFGPTIEDSKEGGLTRLGGFRPMSVGPYAGASYHAQLLTLLHEFGHVLGMLPIDYNNVAGRSMQNSVEVLRYCRQEIEAPARHLKAPGR